ncbi:Spherulation-specific family 4 [Geodermatophilus amargosae]|uniref:Spherulation-specific family 4 n=2 Tax=Geodermatophilus amargosae TaxID=1296565 RepID=A0A1I6YY99_9ACTN|nr:Spherulation-specific family 4 [Geodermatophilus amargosae]
MPSPLPRIARLRNPVVRPPEWLARLMSRLVLGTPALAVAAFMVERPGRVDSTGREMTRAWLFDQWARIAEAGSAVRVVVVEGSVRGLRPDWTTYGQWTAALDACRAAGQQLYGYVPVTNGTRPLAEVAAEVTQWQANLGSRLTGIYLDEGPVSCSPAVAASYRGYAQHIRSLGLRVYPLAPQWPDDATDAAGVSDPWMRQLDPDFLQLWEEGVDAYLNRYGALDFCDTQNLLPPPAWWTALWGWQPGVRVFGHSARRVHTINDCPDAPTMRQVIALAIQRSARTVWVTRARQDPVLGSVYDELPPYWDEMVAFIRTP